MRTIFTLANLFFLMGLNLVIAQSFEVETKIIPNDAVDGETFYGIETAISGNAAIISKQDGPNAVIIEFDGNRWVEKQTLIASDYDSTESNVQGPLGITNSAAIIGHPWDESRTGSAYIYMQNGDIWQEEIKLIASDATQGAYFGGSVDISGNSAIVGAYGANAAYIYKYNGTAWVEEQILVPNDLNAASFGTSVAINENIAIVGAPNDREIANVSGAAFIYRFNGSTWQFEAKIKADDASEYDYLGFDVDIDGNNVIVASKGNIGFTSNKIPAAYIFNFDGTNWVQETKLTWGTFGSGTKIPSVAIENNRVAVGLWWADAFYGTVYLYNYDGANWIGSEGIWPYFDRLNGENFGRSVALDHSTLLVGAPGAAGGAAYLYEFYPMPGNITASDGQASSRIKITWENRTSNAEGFRIYRDGQIIGTTELAGLVFYDIEAVPGKLHKYEVSAYSNENGESLAGVADLGWRRTNGTITGTVQTQQGAGVKDVVVSAEVIDNASGFSINFDGADDYVKVPFIAPSDSMTISAWIKTSSFNHQQILSWGNPVNGHTLEFKTMNGRFAWRESDDFNGPGSEPINENTSSSRIDNDEWQHAAVVLKADSLYLYINGIVETAEILTEFNADVANLTIGAVQTRTDLLQPFSGGISEVQLWQRALTTTEIRKNIFSTISGNEPGLASYWSFNDSSRSSAAIAMDLAHGGNNHGNIIGATWSNESAPISHQALSDINGDYRIRNIYYGEESLFRVTPQKTDHAFDPQYRDVLLGNAGNEVAAFTDTTVFTLSGQILFAGESCPVQGVELLVNNQQSGIFTDSQGNFQVAIEEPGKTYTLTPRYGDSLAAHTFSPSSQSFLVESDIDNILFNDTQKNLLYGKVRGSCIAGLGTANIRITSLQNPQCLDTTISTDVDGNWRLFFPAQEYIVDLVAIDNPDSTNILNYFSVDTLDITWQNKNRVFIYHPKPLVKLEILPLELTCDNVPVMAQGSSYSIIIDVLEVLGSDTCHVNEGFVTIYDDIGGNPAEPTVIQLVNGRALYSFFPGEPNILGGGTHPYQKLLQIEANVDGQVTAVEQWALVTGTRPRTQTFFSTTTPELPLMILRDPPGDQSYSFLSKGSTYSTNFFHSIDTTKTESYVDGAENRTPNYLFLNPGVIKGIGVGVEYAFGAYGIVALNNFYGDDNEISDGNSLSLSMYEELRTSDSDAVTGEKGDVFIGASLNQTFYLADSINYDVNSCQVIKDTTLVVDYTGFNSTYVYTEQHISSTLIPQLQELASLAESNSVHKYENAISVWRQVLQKNRDAKAAAEFERFNPNIDPQFLLEKNISFSGGTSTTQFTTIQTGTFNTVSYKTIVEGDGLIGFGGVIAGGIYELGFQWNYQYTDNTINDTTTTETNTVGFTLADDDDGDYFSVNVKRDPVNGTPIFDLVAGTSSCPWEPGTQPRDGAQLGINSFIQNDVPADEPAVFELALGNISESGETRPYDLRMLQLSNPDGAIIKVGGVAMGDALSYFIPAGDSSYVATLTVERGPRAYDYDNIQLALVPPCEFDSYRGFTPLADTITFSVHFASPITKTNLSYPQDNWQITTGQSDSLAIVINEYNPNNEYLQSVKLQYRKPNGSWITAFDVNKEQLPTQSLRRSWQLQGLDDGDYELRAVSDGGSNGVRYSAVAKGRIERNALMLNGTPQPADNILNRADEIAVSFASAIDLDNLNIERDVSLLNLSDSTEVAFSAFVLGNKLVIQPDSAFTYLGEHTLQATVANISDKQGKRLSNPLSWQFKVSQQDAYWKSFANEIKVYKDVETVHTAVLYNAGSEEIAYNIDHLPQWLSIDEQGSSGMLEPGSAKHLVLKPNTSLQQGMFNDSLLISLAGEQEARYLALHVLATPPQWSQSIVSNGAYSAPVYVQLLLDEMLSEDSFDMAAAFIADRLAGMGHVRLDETSGKYIAAFSVYNSTASGQALDFRLWDASAGKEYRFYNDEFGFQAGSSIGSRQSPLIIEPNEIFQSIALESGVNWLSFNVSSPDLSVEHVLKEWPAQEGDIIKGQFGFSQYSSESGWTGTLHSLNPQQSYRLKTQSNGELLTAGSPAELWVTPAAIKAGWNWIGYLPEKELELKDALQFMQAVPGDIIKSQGKSAIFNNNGEWLGTLKQMRPGSGYLLYSQADNDLLYPILEKRSDNSGQLNVHTFEANMTVTAAFSFDGLDYGDSTLVVSAYIAEQLVGVGHPQYVAQLERFITFLTIYANPESNGETIELQLFNAADGVTREVSEFLVFEADAHFGELAQPLLLEALQTTSERIPADFYLQQNYPNPFNPSTSIEYGLPVDGKVSLKIYDILGKEVAVLVNKKQAAGRYRLQFNSAQIGLASGVYFYQIRSKAFTKSYKMLLLK